MTFNPHTGFEFIDGLGQTIPLKKLSSGEQNQIILAYQLIFEVTQNAIILIDEPEMSLHVVWQNNFLTDIQTIVKHLNATVIIATHSPQIIDNRWDLTVELQAQDD